MSEFVLIAAVVKYKVMGPTAALWQGALSQADDAALTGTGSGTGAARTDRQSADRARSRPRCTCGAFSDRAIPSRLLLLLATAASLLAVLPANQASAEASGPSSITATEGQVAALEHQILLQSEQVTTLSEQFDEASSALAGTNRQLSQIATKIALTKLEAASQRSHLRRDAIDQFTQDAPASELGLLLDANVSQVGVKSQYMGAILGNTSADLSRLEASRTHLADLQAHLREAQVTEAATVVRIRSAKNAATAASETEQATLAGVKGRLATEIALRAAAQARAAAIQAQQAATAAQRQAADEVAAQSSLLAATIGSQPTTTSPGSAPTPPPIMPGSSAGAIAVRAAESQLGVPYVWGGATPGVGFDCSGLTMWAWAQAGVQLAHFAATQYDETTHVALSSLQPGDLLFYDFSGNGIDHVTMYVGSGPFGSATIIQAAHTGTDVMFSPIWYSGLVGAGRP